MKEISRVRREPVAENSLLASFYSPLLQPTQVCSASLVLCGLELRVIPKQSALIQGARGLERSAARAPSLWPVLTHATLDPLYTHRCTHRLMQPLISLGSML